MSDYATIDTTGIALLLVLFMGFLLGLLIAAVTSGSHHKSKVYRKYLTNLLVAGKIKQIAERDKVDMAEVELDFLKFLKQSKRDRMEELDSMIEQDINTEISSSADKKAK